MEYKILKILIFLILFLTSSNIFNTRDDYISGKEDDMSLIVDGFITDDYETDSEEIKEYFLNGLSKTDMMDILEKKSDYVKKSGKYQMIEYNFERKLHYEDIEEMLINMNNLDIVSLERLYKTVDDRYIYGLEIGKGDKVIYIDANIHSGEVGNTVMLMKYLTELLNSYYSGDRDIINKLKEVKLAIIPCINPDGYEIYNFGKNSINNKTLWIYQNYDLIDIDHLKFNANGVDVNRNFPSQNGGLYFRSNKLLKSVSLTKTTKRGTYFGGDILGSENETKACMYFMLKHYKHTYAYLDMHSQGRVIYNGKPNLSYEFNKISRKFAEYVSSFNNYKVHGLSAEEVGEGNDGTATDFMAELAHDFKYSTKTNRLSTSKYIDNNSSLVYNYPVITLESLTTYSRDTKLFKKEYYDLKIRDLLFDLLNCNFIN